MMVSGVFSLLLYVTDFPLCIYIYKNIVSVLGGNFYSDSSPAFKTAHKKLACLTIYGLSFFRCGGSPPPSTSVCVCTCMIVVSVTFLALTLSAGWALYKSLCYSL